ncbi:hypothetical protein [Kineosporia sp. NBRC 101731]|uniref:hypothetical protein n=1 Tax=Kineosporia sp. NBRC 101731 TaxID=3032199 RepID=UPI0024A05F64|nr:hypothetical protein [Kineosporia sp. NBRC 101731]GLY26818.1 hypothetical protein Kisp02_01830 [Kineosporia sp. NBRC 101731]
MPKVSLRTVVQAMPSRQVEELALQRDDPGLKLDVSDAEGYVWPQLNLDTITPSASILLIRAPGAMGKSMASRAIAHAIKAPKVDLAKVHVGSNSLSGMFLKSFGPGNAAQFMFALQQGHMGLVLDGLDEAQLKAGHDHFWSFLEDVAALLAGAVPMRQVVVLGRPDSIFAAELAFGEMGISYEVADLLPLDAETFIELIDVTLDNLKVDGNTYTTHRVHPQPFAEFRRAVTNDLALALEPDISVSEDYWARVDYFLGYPPVVLSLARRMAVPNPQSEANDLLNDQRSHKTSVDRGILLKEIVETILDRESVKVRESVAQSLQLSDEKRDLLYTREEQTLRVISYVSKVSLDLTLPASLSTSERVAYEELVGTFVPDHPFILDSQLANVVFADYLRAFVTVAETTALHGVKRADLIGACPPPGPFYVHFVSGLSPDATDHDSVDESMIGDLVRSYIAGSRGPAGFTLAQGGETYSLVLYPTNEDGSWVPDINPIHFSIPMTSGVVELTGPLARATVALREASLVLNASTQGELELGPGVLVVVDSLEIRAASIAVVQAKEAASVFLSARDFTGDPKARVTSRSDHALMVNWPDCWHPWRAFESRIAYVGTDGAFKSSNARKVSSAIVGMRRILTSFKQSAAAEPALHREMFDNLIIGKNEIFRAALRRLMEMDIVRLDSQLYRLSLPNLKPFGVSYAALRAPGFAETLRPLMIKALESEDFRQSLTGEG